MVGRLEQVDAELQGPDPGWSETLFDHLRTSLEEVISFSDIAGLIVTYNE